MHPEVTGRPARLMALRDLLVRILDNPEVAFLTHSELAAAYPQAHAEE